MYFEREMTEIIQGFFFSAEQNGTRLKLGCCGKAGECLFSWLSHHHLFPM